MTAAVSVGRIVQYVLTEQDAQAVNQRRADADNFGARSNRTGYAVHVGNAAEAGQVFPLLVVRVWEDGPVNGQVFLDGTDVLWVTSSNQGDQAGQWRWPERV